jgi:HPt (histidine-containing phosphotransfer) domain-containing protein
VADPPSMLSQLHDIGDRYLRRTLREAEQLQELVSKGIGGDSDCAKQTEQLAHKIHGSGAMFGFNDVSERAGQIERLVSERAADLASVARELTALVMQLQQAVRSAAAARGIEG